MTLRKKCYWCNKVRLCKKANLLYGKWVCEECDTK